MSIVAAIHRASYGLAAIGAVLVVLMMLQVILDILGKLVFRFPIPGTIEIVSHYYMVGATFLPMALVEIGRGHFIADMFKATLPPRVISAIDAFNGMVLVLVSALVTWRTLLNALEATQVGEHVRTAYFTIPIWPTRWFLPVSFALLAAVAFVHVLEHARAAAGAPAPRAAGKA
jgi:TRAP-type C4-dicarboxylate transport system permease small subunit